MGAAASLTSARPPSRKLMHVRTARSDRGRDVRADVTPRRAGRGAIEPEPRDRGADVLQVVTERSPIEGQRDELKCR